MIFPLIKKNQKLKSNNSNNNSNEGFSLFEVLIALALGALMLGVLVGGTFTDSQKLDDTLLAIEKAIRFSADESVLRNRIVRISFDLSATPQIYMVEYGPTGDFVLPTVATNEETDGLTLAEMEKQKKDKETIDSKFIPVKEYKEKVESIPENVKIIGIGSELHNNLVLDGKTSVYLYPTGEKDASIIFIGTSDEVVALNIEPFKSDLIREYITLDDVSSDELEEQQIEVAKKLFEKWLKN